MRPGGAGYHPPVLIPLGTDRPLARRTVINHVLIGLNLGIFILQLATGHLDNTGQRSVMDQFVLAPGESPWYTYITYAFLHGGLLHILGNMLFLWVFGPCVEDRLGRFWYVLFYLGGAVLAGMAHEWASDARVLGASGAVSAVTGAFLVLFPRTVIRVLLFFILIGVFSIPAWWFVAFAIARDFLPVLAATEDNVAREAHLGGYAFGIGVSMFLLWTKILSREQYDLFSLMRQRRRRGQIRQAAKIAAPKGVINKKDKASRSRAKPTQQKPPEDDQPAPPDDRPQPESQEDELLAPEGPAAEARAVVTAALARQDYAAAAEAYRSILGEYGHTPRAVTLGRRQQMDLGNALFQQGDHQTAAKAYELYLESFPSDADAPTVALMLALLNARYLNDPVRAKSLLSEARDRLGDDQQRTLADELLAELG